MILFLAGAQDDEQVDAHGGERGAAARRHARANRRPAVVRRQVQRERER
jgi:hypothetical protein